MPSLSTLLKLSLTLLAASQVYGSPIPQEGGEDSTDTSDTSAADGTSASTENTNDGMKTLPHDAVMALPQTVPQGPDGLLYTTYQPRLETRHGCVPFPAVDAAGQIGRGLNPSGPSSGSGSSCDNSTGQVYVRKGTVPNYVALLYTYYHPKDQVGHSGTRHDFDGVVIYLKSAADLTPANIYAVCPAAAGAWTCETKFSLDATFPLLAYDAHHGNDTNSLYFGDSKEGKQYPVAAWESMTGPAQDALSKYDYGKVQVPFIDAHFTEILALAVPPEAPKSAPAS